jgi:hypothetical protein
MKKTIFLLLAISWQVVAQEAKFSNPMAPVTNTELTVPKEVKPIFDYWLRDTYVTLGPMERIISQGQLPRPIEFSHW